MVETLKMIIGLYIAGFAVYWIFSSLKKRDCPRGKTYKNFRNAFFICLITGGVMNTFFEDKINDKNNEIKTKGNIIADRSQKDPTIGDLRLPEKSGFFSSDYDIETKIKQLQDNANSDFNLEIGKKYRDDADFFKKIDHFTDKVFKINNIPQSLKENFTNCIHLHIWDKGRRNDTDTLEIPLRQCWLAYVNKEIFKKKYFNPTYVMANFDFNSWSRSIDNHLLTRFIKENLNDKNSFEHIATWYSIRDDENPPSVWISTSFRAKNAFGGVVKEKVWANFDEQGKIIDWGQE